MTNHGDSRAASRHGSTRRTVLAAGLGIAVSRPAFAQSYPSRPVRLIVPFPPAGAADVISRLLGDPLSKALGQQIVIDNRTGAGGRVGTEAAVRAEPDGYNIFMGSQATNSINPELYEKLPFDPAKDLVPVAAVGGVGSVLYVRNSLDVHSLPQLLERARAKPGGFTYGSAGNGGGSHLAMALLESMARVQFVHVPYRGTAPATTDVLAGQIDMLCDVITTGLPHVRAGSVRALAVTTPQRHPALPDVPTMAEAGVPGYEAVSYYGLFAPLAVPPAVLTTLRSTLAKVLAEEAMVRKLAEQGMEPLGLTPDGFADYIARDRARWGGVIRSAGIKPT